MIHRAVCLSVGLIAASCASAPAPVPEPERPIDSLPLAVLSPAHSYDPIVRERLTASLWNQEPQSLFGNRRARNVGDILTVLVSVNENAQIQNSLSSSRSNEEDFNVNALFGLNSVAQTVLPQGASLTPGVDVTRNASAQGSGSISRQENIQLSLAAQVVEQLPNGHLVILGTQKIRVNQEMRELQVSGVVRPEDITRDNTISHDKIASADILYSGQGQINRETRPRLGSRVLDFVVPF